MSLINHDVLNRFGRLLKSGRMAHAYLFAGPKGIGKSQTALFVAKLVNCEKRILAGGLDACGECPSCRRISSGSHPDVYFIDRGETESIKIAQVRDVIARLQMRAFEGVKKVCVVKDIETMTVDGGNALLKTLEEPPADTLFILTTSVPEENLSTVVSRCHLIKFFPLAASVLQKRLIREQNIDEAEAQCLSQFSQGCPSSAEDLRGRGFLREKNEMIDNLILTENNDVYLKKILGDKLLSQVALNVVLSWFRDLLLLKSTGQKKYLAHPDRYDELLTLEKKYSFVRINGIIKEVVGALALLRENLNVKIPFVLLREKIWAR